MKCPKCHSDIPNDSQYCPDCGAVIEREEDLRKEASSIASSYKKGYDYYVSNGTLPQFSSWLSVEAYKRIISLKKTIISKHNDILRAEKEKREREERARRDREQRERQQREEIQRQERERNNKKARESLYDMNSNLAEKKSDDGAGCLVGIIFGVIFYFIFLFIFGLFYNHIRHDVDYSLISGILAVIVAFFVSKHVG